MKLYEKQKDWSGNRTFQGRKKKFEVTVCFAEVSLKKEEPYWYYTLIKKDEDLRYNSLWDNLNYSSQEECVEACEKKIDELTTKMR